MYTSACCRSALCHQHNCYFSISKMTMSHGWYRAKLVANWKCQKNISSLTLPAQSLDLNQIENLYSIKYNLVDSQETSDSQAHIERVAHPRLEPWSHPRQPVHSIQTRCR